MQSELDRQLVSRTLVAAKCLLLGTAVLSCSSSSVSPDALTPPDAQVSIPDAAVQCDKKWLFTTNPTEAPIDYEVSNGKVVLRGQNMGPGQTGALQFGWYSYGDFAIDLSWSDPSFSGQGRVAFNIIGPKQVYLKYQNGQVTAETSGGAMASAQAGSHGRFEVTKVGGTLSVKHGDLELNDLGYDDSLPYYWNFGIRGDNAGSETAEISVEEVTASFVASSGFSYTVVDTFDCDSVDAP